MELLNRPVDDKPVGVMVPIPQYPLYSATVAEFGMHQVRAGGGGGRDGSSQGSNLCESERRVASRDRRVESGRDKTRRDREFENGVSLVLKIRGRTGHVDRHH